MCAAMLVLPTDNLPSGKHIREVEFILNLSMSLNISVY